MGGTLTGLQIVDVRVVLPRLRGVETKTLTGSGRTRCWVLRERTQVRFFGKPGKDQRRPGGPALIARQLRGQGRHLAERHAFPVCTRRSR